jgi:hypothetical protein
MQLFLTLPTHELGSQQNFLNDSFCEAFYMSKICFKLYKTVDYGNMLCRGSMLTLFIVQVLAQNLNNKELGVL